MANEFPARELSNMVALFQRAHSKVTALARMDDQIAALVVQHERLQEEVRAVQAEINQEFERALKFNQAPSKLPGTVGVAAATLAANGEQPRVVLSPSPVQVTIRPPNGEQPKTDNGSGEVIPLARI